MSLPGNGIFVVQGEMSMLVTAMRRSTRWGSHSFPNEEYDVLTRTFQDLKTILNQVDDLRLLDPLTYLSPFLEIGKTSNNDQISPEIDVEEAKQVSTHNQDKNLLNEAEITIEPVDQVKSPKKHARHSSMDLASNASITHVKLLAGSNATDEGQGDAQKLEEYVNHRGIRFTQQEESSNLQPYGLVCVKELFRFLISLINPLEPQNTSAMVQLGLSLVGTALEVAADHLASCPALLGLVRDPLCRNLISLLDTERISIFALDLQLWFLLFEALRGHLKYQMEAFFKKIIEIISADTTKSIYELKEIHHIALESLCQMFRIPGLCTELYLNFDCVDDYDRGYRKSGTAPKEDVEVGEVDVQREKEDRVGHVTLELGGMDDASVVSDHVTHDISQYFVPNARQMTQTELPTDEELDHIKDMKKWVTQGTELFNQKPERGIEFLLEHGVLSTPLDPKQVAMFLRENPDLDKKMIGEYICKRSSREEDSGPSILSAFADSFDYSGLRIDQALRLYLETFRLPGEAPLISLVMEKFAERWHLSNGEPFANTDAAFRLAYAVIMLNVDQHNHNAKKLNVPMTVEDFTRNLRGCNGSDDFDHELLQTIFHAIKNEEMIMPAERVGPLRDAYLWRVLQRRAGRTLVSAPPAPHRLHARLLPLAAPPAVTALSAAFERAAPPSAEDVEVNNLRDCAALIALSGLERCAALVARLSPPTLTLDTVLLTLCKFTGLLTPQHSSYIAIGVSLGQSSKAMCSIRRACVVAARHADCCRDSWRHLLEIVNTLYIARLLPKCLVEAEDYLSPNGTVFFDTRYFHAALRAVYYPVFIPTSHLEKPTYFPPGVRAPTPHEKSLMDAAAECVSKCNFPGILITETRFLQMESLQELISAMIAIGAPPDSDSLQLNPQLEDITIFFLELLGQTLIQNR
ncbi:unnamed protein product [Danaus chrysippus]|uniref:(African queen) hypothetical protein n=1 Tax=Danaus chrysippus TaxID=151541 RepID=A0A8J2QQ13_9NEOP|nr:unnamed protein product [Danaus chrysippus]